MVNLGSPNINLCLKYFCIKVVRLVSKGEPNLFNKSKSKLSIIMIIFEDFDDDVKEPTSTCQTLFGMERKLDLNKVSVHGQHLTTNSEC